MVSAQDYAFIEYTLPESAAACKKAHEARSGRFTTNRAAPSTPASAAPPYAAPAPGAVAAASEATGSDNKPKLEGEGGGVAVKTEAAEVVLSDKAAVASHSDVKAEPPQEVIAEATKAAVVAAADGKASTDEKPAGDHHCMMFSFQELVAQMNTPLHVLNIIGSNTGRMHPPLDISYTIANCEVLSSVWHS